MGEVGSGLENNFEVSLGLWALSRATSENNDRILDRIRFQAMFLTWLLPWCRELGESLAHALGRGTEVCLALGVRVPWGEIWAESGRRGS